MMNEPITTTATTSSAPATATTAPSSAMGAAPAPAAGAGMGNPAQMVQMLAAMPPEQRAMFAQSLRTYSQNKTGRQRMTFTFKNCSFSRLLRVLFNRSFYSYCFVFFISFLLYFWSILL